ncbi:MAG: UDP-N-acetylglucosamine 2-epimerase (non-hydrolyzing) [Bacteroidota bacterium]
MIKILSVVGARPNFMKIAPLHRAFQKEDKIISKIVHTGQHYDERMSDIFFNQLELPKPDFYLGVAGGSHTFQKANVMLAFEKILLEEKPDLVVVVGDVNATAATSIVAVKMGIPTAHVEAGLRSGDRQMPEEINRVLTDSIVDMHFVTEQAGLVHLAKENIPKEKVHFVGNVMIDSLVHFREKAKANDILQQLGIAPKSYILMTMHRPSNVDNTKSLNDILKIVKNATQQLPIIFPMHPRTSKNLNKFHLYKSFKDVPNLTILEPQGYLPFLHLMDNAKVIITDSGGIQEETTFLQIPCLTFRSSTERPITVELGTNQLLSDLNPVTVASKLADILNGKTKKGIIPPFWDGHAADRITQIILAKFDLK